MTPLDAALLGWAFFATFMALWARLGWKRALQGWRDAIAIAVAANTGWGNANAALIEAASQVEAIKEALIAGRPAPIAEDRKELPN